MRLEDMTKTQLLNIILRKDDVETRLRAEIATLKQENKRMGRASGTRTIGVCILLAVICLTFLTLTTSCYRHGLREKNRIDKIAFEHPLITIGEVTFAVNVLKNEIVLISSTQVDDPKVMSVVNYLNSIYGEAWEDEPYNYWWNTDGHNKVLGGSTVRLRPLHSEEGGTVIIID